MGRKMSKFTIFAVRMKNTRFKVMELYGLGSRQLSYGFWASVLKNDTCTYAKYSLQGTTQGRYLTGDVPPVRFSM